MTTLLKKLPGFEISPSGIEERILHHLFKIFLVGSFCISLPLILVRLFPNQGIHTSLSLIDTLTIVSLVFYFIAVAILGIGALIVRIMKGPAYVADAYYVTDADL